MNTIIVDNGYISNHDMGISLIFTAIIFIYIIMACVIYEWLDDNTMGPQAIIFAVAALIGPLLIGGFLLL